ncbi:SDR family oxidoreductase [Planctomicrobium sp. SH661]|uniref:SDR family oxidoreductase n=1 Tax=Planctomicrobium sp. SH661 TaxID=3448124 RepID=UPI003F5B64D4
MDFGLQGKVILITGGSAGIGRAAAIAFAEAGSNVAICARDQQAMDDVVSDIGNRTESMSIEADVSSAEEMKKVVARIIDRWGRLDFVFANAGINGVWAPVDEITPAEWDKTISTNLTGTFLTLHYSIPHLKRHGGAVVITSSVNGTRMFSNSGATAYACTKAAQVAMAKMLACELAEHRIRVNVICPGAIETEIEGSTEKRDLEHFEERVEFKEGAIPLTHGKPGTAMEVAELVRFLCSNQAQHITGTEIWIDGAQSLIQG